MKTQASDIAAKLQRRRLGANTVQVGAPRRLHHPLRAKSASKNSVTEASEIYRLGCFLLAREKLVHRPLRLLGLGVSNLHEPSATQLALL